VTGAGAAAAGEAGTGGGRRGWRNSIAHNEEAAMLTWAIIALVIAVIAGALGFSGVAAAAGTVAKVLFGLFLAVAILLFVLAALAV
jgi:uncharacterized membrane protein YtjA (UPF0391 family)